MRIFEIKDCYPMCWYVGRPIKAGEVVFVDDKLSTGHDIVVTFDHTRGRVAGISREHVVDIDPATTMLRYDEVMSGSRICVISRGDIMLTLEHFDDSKVNRNAGPLSPLFFNKKTRLYTVKKGSDCVRCGKMLSAFDSLGLVKIRLDFTND